MGPKDDDGPTFVAGISVDLDPTAGKNIAGDQESFTTLAENDKSTKRPDGTDFDDTHEFDFGQIAAGVYKLSVSDGWRARMGPMGADAMVGYAFNPLEGDVLLDVTPATTTVYGYVRDSEEFPVDEVTVTVNGVEAISDVHGRYIAQYVGSDAREVDDEDYDDHIFVETDHEDNKATQDIVAFAANSRIQQDVVVSGVGRTAAISGTVTASGSGDPVAGAEIRVDGEAPTNAATRGANSGKLVTGPDGSYRAVIAAKDIGETADVSVTRKGMSFVPAEQTVPAHGGADIGGINFTAFLHATIEGRVKDPDGDALGGVVVTATNVVDGGADAEVSSTSNARGTFRLSVPFGVYDIEASLANYTFKYPNDNQRVNVAPGQPLDFGDIQAMSPGARGLTASRARTPDDEDT